ncbi:MAG: zinc ribbon domain-containing protein [Opitutales bacterium]|nr:zinc ribbon domain-containing protein [Opitutales bacterium]
MPTYDYTCDSCGHEQEVFQSMKDDPLKDCPACGEPAFRRRIGAGAGLIFKGSGFYITDYKKNQTDGSKNSGEKKKVEPSEKKSSTGSKSADSVGKAADGKTASTP